MDAGASSSTVRLVEALRLSGGRRRRHLVPPLTAFKGYSGKWKFPEGSGAALIERDGKTRYPGALVNRVNRLHRRTLNAVKEFRQAVIDGNFFQNPNNIDNHVQRTARLVMDSSFAYQGELRDPASVHDPYYFALFGGVDVLIQMLVKLSECPDSISTTSMMWRRRWCVEIMACIRELSFSVHYVNRDLGMRDDLLRIVFNFMKSSETFDHAVQLAEELIVGRGRIMIASTEIPEIPDHISRMAPSRLALFCRIISLLVYEPEEKKQDAADAASLSFDHSSPPSMGAPIKAVQLLRVRRMQCPDGEEGTPEDQNHLFFANIPCFVPRMVKLLQLCAEREPVDVETLAAHVQQDAALYASIGGVDGANEWGDEGGSANRQSNPEETFRRMFDALRLGGLGDAVMPQLREAWDTVKWATLKTHEVEVLFVLCSMMGGKHKRVVQDLCTAANLVGTLCALFDRMMWDPRHVAPELADHERPHGPDCQCNQESTVKIQLLRLVHNYCDRDEVEGEVKRQMMTDVERNEGGDSWSAESLAGAKAYAPDMGLIEIGPGIPGMPRDNSHGLAHRIILAFQMQPVSSTYRFWLAACIEAFLRTGSPERQCFVLRLGLLDHIITCLLSEDFKSSSNSLQTDFDLLGEIIKFSELALRVLNTKLGSETFTQLMDLAVHNLVDSNVFIRSLLLTEESVRTKNPDYSSDTCVVSKWVRAHSIPTAIKLMGCVSLEQVSQDNICTINTSLVVFIFARREDMMASAVSSVRAETARKEGSEGQLSVLQNFRRLLWFWRSYYTARKRDKCALAYSSGIPFSEWERVVAILCARGEGGLLLENDQPDLPGPLDLLSM